MQHLFRTFGLPILAFAVLLGAAGPVPAQDKDTAPPRWIADAKTGCKVWDPSPQPQESVRWSGSCENGLAAGEGILQWYQKGRPSDRYEGGYQGGKRNGHGVVTFGNGRRVEGDWRDDELLQMGRNEI